MNDDIVRYLQDLTKLVEQGEVQGVVVYATKSGSAHYGVVGSVGLDDFSILSVRASVSAADCLRNMERDQKEADAKSTRQ